jgi:hypothetical protein
LRVHEFRKFIELPSRTGERFEVALDIDPEDEKDRKSLVDGGWNLTEPRTVTADPWSYRSYIQRSGAEFMVAKNLYVDTWSGWFSDRSICYLASAKPVLAQNTGFDRRYPTGVGLLCFSTIDEAVEGVEAIKADYRRHAQAAREIAEEFFDAKHVLRRLLVTVGVT